MQAVQPSTPLKIEVAKGFWAHIQGQFQVVNPGDVVECDRQVAVMAIAAGKAQLTDKSPVRQTNYLPERKRKPKQTTHDLLDALVKATEANTAAIAQLVAAQAKKKD